MWYLTKEGQTLKEKEKVVEFKRQCNHVSERGTSTGIVVFLVLVATIQIEDPPEYKLSNVKTDVGIFWSRGDQFVPPENVRELIRDLGPRVKKNHFIDDPYYTHVHFAVALNNPEVLHKDLLEFLNRYASTS
ncbi:hypothetical protein HPB48_020902 [Haemaphysalis longicornis]|uniref:Uncharacterized protein n=1 Tax=Haemaphysalis longicornis TaxID=44386 RepID=A0A9J6H0S0_HAELO|nr:hypothetical protein HPB48_020902 [Haemaphysalis longicornis]